MGANVRERRSFPPPPSTDAIRRLAKNAVDTVSCDVERPTVEFALRVDKKIKFIAVGGNRPYRSRFPPKRNRCCQSRFKINSTTRLHQCSIHVSQPHSQTRDTHTYTLTISRDLKNSKIRPRQNARAYCRDLTRVCLRLPSTTGSMPV